jgi:hypothetical protein
MGIHIDVRIDLSERQKRFMRWCVVTGSAIAALGIGVAFAGGIDTSWISSGQPVNALSLSNDLNGLQEQISGDGGLQAQLGALQSQIAGAAAAIISNGATHYSVGPTRYVGATSATFTGDIGSYAATKSDCENAFSPTAHMCSGEELLRSAALGLAIGEGWYSASAASTGAVVTADCNGWTSAASSNGGLFWEGYPGIAACDNTFVILCCE